MSRKNILLRRNKMSNTFETFQFCFSALLGGIFMIILLRLFHFGTLIAFAIFIPSWMLITYFNVYYFYPYLKRKYFARIK
jgi:hypothetical protein